VERDIVWRKSSQSGGEGDCVEVAMLPEAVLVRDSKDPDGARLRFNPARWRAFVEGLRTHSKDHDTQDD